MTRFYGEKGETKIPIYDGKLPGLAVGMVDDGNLKSIKTQRKRLLVSVFLFLIVFALEHLLLLKCIALDSFDPRSSLSFSLALDS